MQKVNFNYELIIGDDFSVDNTSQICLDYKKKYPLIIKYKRNKNNLGMNPNFVQTLNSCTGKYIALCEGDDYWIDSNKPQKQVDFLEANNEFSICHHNMQVVYDDDRPSHQSNPPEQKEVTSIEDLAEGNYIYTASCIFRNGLIKEYPEWFKESPVGDYILHMLNAQYGKIRYFSEMMGCYRIHKQGVWGKTSYETMLVKWIKMQDSLICHFDSNINKIILRSQMDNLVNYFKLINLSGSRNEFTTYIPKCYSIYSEKVIEYENKVMSLNSIIEAIKKSKSYKIGNFIIKPFVYLRNLITYS